MESPSKYRMTDEEIDKRIDDNLDNQGFRDTNYNTLISVKEDYEFHDCTPDELKRINLTGVGARYIGRPYDDGDYVDTRCYIFSEDLWKFWFDSSRLDVDNHEVIVVG